MIVFDIKVERNCTDFSCNLRLLDFSDWSLLWEKQHFWNLNFMFFCYCWLLEIKFSARSILTCEVFDGYWPSLHAPPILEPSPCPLLRLRQIGGMQFSTHNGSRPNYDVERFGDISTLRVETCRPLKMKKQAEYKVGGRYYVTRRIECNRMAPRKRRFFIDSVCAEKSSSFSNSE